MQMQLANPANDITLPGSQYLGCTQKLCVTKAFGVYFQHGYKIYEQMKCKKQMHACNHSSHGLK